MVILKSIGLTGWPEASRWNYTKSRYSPNGYSNTKIINQGLTPADSPKHNMNPKGGDPQTQRVMIYTQMIQWVYTEHADTVQNIHSQVKQQIESIWHQPGSSKLILFLIKSRACF